MAPVGPSGLSKVLHPSTCEEKHSTVKSGTPCRRANRGGSGVKGKCLLPGTSPLSNRCRLTVCRAPKIRGAVSKVPEHQAWRGTAPVSGNKFLPVLQDYSTLSSPRGQTGVQTTSCRDTSSPDSSWHSGLWLGALSTSTNAQAPPVSPTCQAG